MPAEPAPHSDPPPAAPTRREFASRVVGGVALSALGTSPAGARRVGRDCPHGVPLTGLKAAPKAEAGRREVNL